MCADACSFVMTQEVQGVRGVCWPQIPRSSSIQQASMLFVRKTAPVGFCQAGSRASLSPCIPTMTASSASTVLEVSTSPLPVPSTMSKTCSSSKSVSWFLKQLHLGCLHESGPCRLAMCVVFTLGLPSAVVCRPSAPASPHKHVTQP